MNNKTTLVTIVTLTYKNFEKLHNTIRSVLAQDYGNIEYIICDDGSEGFPYNRVLKLIDQYKRNSISVKILQNTLNVGTVKNINRAYKEASGKYILNLSCGDVFFTDTVVSQIVKRFEETNAKVLVTTRLFYENSFQPICLLPHYEERKILKLLDTPLKQYKAFILSRYYDMASGSAMYFSNETMKKYNYFDERYRLWEDGPFLAKYLWNEKLEMAYDIVSIWYEKGGVSTNTNSPARMMMLKDRISFNLGERLEHFDIFTENEKKIIDNNNKRYIIKNNLELLYLRFKYLPQILSNIIYWKQRDKYKEKDMVHIKELMEQYKEHILPKKVNANDL